MTRPIITEEPNQSKTQDPKHALQDIANILHADLTDDQKVDQIRTVLQ